MKNLYLTLSLLCIVTCFAGYAQTSSFSFTTGVVQLYTVPPGVSQVAIDMAGAQAGAGDYGNSGKGGRVQCTVNVTPAQVYSVYVGNIGIANGANTGTWGYNGLYYGGNGVVSSYSTGGGGAGTEIWFGGSVFLVAGGGGSTGGDCTSDYGGPGGGPTGANGEWCGAYSATYCGAGGTQSTGGAVGSVTGCGGTAGSRGTGGNGGENCTNWAGAGGGGYYGGGGAVDFGGGGGGSSFPASASGNITAITHTQGYRTGAGYVTITALCSGATITGGNTTLCNGATLTLTASASGGTWSSPSSTVSVNGSSGVVTGTSTGAATISYTVGCGSVSTTTVTVIAAPSAISGNSPINVCGSATLTDATGTGTWASSNGSVATVGTASGTSTTLTGGTTSGTSNITFTLTSTGCKAFAVATVNAIPAITGSVTSLCSGNTTTLSETFSGGSGTWSSSNTSAATIGSSTGTVTALPSGSGNPATTTISYTISGGCNVAYPMTINTQPAAITGAGSFCGGSGPTTITLSDATSGGTWSSSNTAQATVGTNGIVTGGTTSGTPNISYTMPGGCFSTATVTANVTAAISGLPNVCVGTTITLTDGTSGGTWSGGSGFATVGATTGIVTGVSLGAAPITYTSSTTGCNAYATVNVTNPPNTYAVTGGGSYCAGGTGVVIGLNGADPLVTYYLFNGATLVTTVNATSSGAFNFGTYTSSGTYTVVANYGNPCFANQSGSAVVSVNSLPTAFTVGGGGSYCSGGTGVNITLSSSTIGVNYQLVFGSTPVGSPVAGTGGALTFGPVTSAGTYTITAANASSGCTNTMAGSATVSISSLPTAFSVTGGGGYCLGGNGVHIGLSGSTVGVNYELLISGSLVTTMSGTGSSLDFGAITVGGTYTVLAINATTNCQMTMSGSATVTINSLPTAFTVTGGGAYCLGGTGSVVSLNGSSTGVNYQLYNGTSATGSVVSGTGAAISFGAQTATGSYTVIATNTTTGCQNNMSGSTNITTNPLPTVFTVTGGGGYCAGAAGVSIGVSGSTVGTTYSLFNGVTLVSAASGTGSALSFGTFSSAGTYVVTALNTSTGCQGNMSGNVTVSINPIPAAFAVTGGGAYCAGGAGQPIGLSSSVTGINYQLYNGATPIGAAIAGTGAAIPFGSQTLAGSYTVIATNATTTCTNNMTGSANITINPLPTVYTVTGGGPYCAGGTGRNVGLAASNVGINYQLFNGSTGGVISAGTGSALNYGLITTAGTYTVTATNPATNCSSGMSGSAVISINALPTPFAVSGGGPYCAGGTGSPVSLGNSTSGVNYQLYNGLTPMGSPVAGTGSNISLGSQTAAGTYTVIGTNASTGCSNNMTGSVGISINPLPAVYAVTGGGNFCTGGTGQHIGLSGSAAGINYQLLNSSSVVVTTVNGTGSAIDFGAQTGAGSYTVVANNLLTNCSSNMTGTANIVINSLPNPNNVTGGGSYCAGGAGKHIGLNGSIIGVSYQLYNGVTPVASPLVGTSLLLDFGAQTAAGTYSVIGTNIVTGCQANMTGTANITVNALPTPYPISGGGNYCVGDTGVVITLGNSTSGVNYQLLNGPSPTGTAIAGNTGTAITFPTQTASGIYTVVGTNTTTGCSGNMTGSAAVGTYPLPTVYNVTGGGNYCSGGTGVNVGLSGSNTGVTYNLTYTGVPIATMAGSGLAISFGAQTAQGTYKITATNNTTGCTQTMNDSANVGVNALPNNTYTVTGGGPYCAGTGGIGVGLSGSDAGIIYQLMNGTPAGSPVAGTGSAISFGNQTIAGTYTVMAMNPATTCTSTMTGSVPVSINALPFAYPVSGGGSYCNGGTGVNISMATSDPGITYQLYNGLTSVGTSQAGPGALNFGNQTAAGTYSVIATNTTTSCTNNMSNTVTVNIEPLPSTYLVTGGGSYCAHGAGVHVGLSNSNYGVTYQLLRGGVPTGGNVAGTGMGIDFGLQTVAGVYTVLATNNLTNCTNMMTGSVNVIVNPLPTLYPVSSTSSTYCAGGSGVHIWLNSSDPGISYQLYNGSTTVGAPLAGSSSSLDFGFYFTPGSYRVVGVNNTTGCNDTMPSGVTIVVNALPTVYAVTGGGAYCSGSTGVHIGLSGSNTGISYQLMMGLLPVGSAVAGTGGAIDFGLQTSVGNYTVVATNPATTCTNNMSGSATVSVNSLPIVYTLNGGGNYCAGGAGVDVQLSNSTPGVDYQLYVGLAVTGHPMAGSGTILDFGAQATAGAYSVIATNTITGCTNNMTSAVTVGINALPTAYSVIGGGNYCPGGAGVNVGLATSAAGITYELFNGGTSTGMTLPGNGSALNFGVQTAAGTYSVIGTDNTTGCASNMSGSAVVGINTLPTVYSVMGGGSYCAGSAGVNVGLSNSSNGVNYKLLNGITTIATLPGNGSPLNFGAQTLAGTYVVQAVNASTGCSSSMADSAVVVVNAVVTPHVSVTSNHADTVCAGTTVMFTATALNGGSLPVYQWMINGVASASGPLYSYIPLNGDRISVTLTSNAVCASPTTASSTVTMATVANETPEVTVSANPGTDVCSGTDVTFTANPSFGGNSPSYAWYVNGNFKMTANSYGYSPANNDVVFCVMTSNYLCASTPTATSSHINMEVDQPLLPVVTITPQPGNVIAKGQKVTLTATVVNGGPTPTYQWLVNGMEVPGAKQPVYESSDFADGDSATCQVLSSGGCAGLLGFNSIHFHVSTSGVQQITAANSDIKLVPNPNKGNFTIKGTLANTNDQEVSLEITDMLGKVVYATKLTARSGVINESIDVGSAIANGMYILSLHADAENDVFHLIIEQ